MATAKISESYSAVTGKAGEYYGAMSSFATSGSTISMVIIVIVAIIIVIFVIESAIKLYTKYRKYSTGQPWILKGTKSAKRRMLVLQDPSAYGSTQLLRSDDQQTGIEFTYAYWMYIDDWSYKYGTWKHILHKGSADSWPNRCPGIWLHPTQNKMRVYINTYNTVAEHIDIDNIPINKWVHVIVTVRQQNTDIYINGNIRKSVLLSSLPKQNNGDLYINNYRGFSGFLSNIKYYNYTIPYSEVEALVKAGPSKMPCVDSGELPPYLSANWWLSDSK